MHEQILIAPNGTELLRMLARNGISTLGLRIMLPVELAQFALMRTGVPVTQTLVTPDTEAAVIYRFLQDIPYFSDASYHDAQNLANTLRMLRMQITDNERKTIADGLKTSPFMEKNTALTEVYDRYMCALQQADMIDTIGIIRLAISRAKPLSADISVLAAYPMTPLEQALIEHLSADTSHSVSFCELLHKPEQPLAMPQIIAAYGAVNETEAVIGRIFAEKLPLDQCTVAVTDAASYAPLMYELASCFAVPVTFGCGLPITMTQPAAVLRDYQKWLTDGYCGIDALRNLLCGPAFDTKQFCQDFQIEKLNDLIETAGSMRLGNDAAVNAERIRQYQSSANRDSAMTERLTKIFADFAMDCPALIRRYAKIRKNDLGRLDSAARNKICDTLERFTAMTGEPAENLINDLLQVRICKENCCEGALHITGITDALTSLRENLYVMGLSAEKFPGAPSENYLLLDDELSVFGENAPTSGSLIRQAQVFLHDLLIAASALQTSVLLSYSAYDTAELKANNASSVLYALYLEAGGTDENAFMESIAHTGYFSQDLPGMTEIGRAYLGGKTVAADEPEPEEETSAEGIFHALTPSKIETYLKCPRSFCYENIMRLRPQETDDVFQVISPADFGSLVHQAMEYCCGRHTSREDFLANAEQLFASFLAERPPMNQRDADKYRQDFRKAVENGYDAVEDMQIEAAEQELSAEYECGITVSGRPDAIIRKPDGTIRVADYKTGKNLKHEPDDCISCIQVMLYADMLHRTGIPVSGGDYRYLMLNEKISCEYTPERSALIAQTVASIADAIRQNDYPATAVKDNCQYCPYKEICKEGGAIS